jgi:predicted regulator of Ras-like GTPase activity (Roadblock/LC7/MglB family)
VEISTTNITLTRTMLVRELVGADGTKYSAQVLIRINNRNSEASISDLTISERIPTELTTSLADMTFQTNYTAVANQRPLILEWRVTGVGAKAETGISYSATTSTKIDRPWVEANILTPGATVAVSTFTSYPGISATTHILQGMLSSLIPAAGFYPAVAIVAAFLLILLYILYEILRLIFHLIMGIQSRRQPIDIIYEYAGAGEKNNKMHIAMGVGLIAVGIVVMQFVAGPQIQKPDVSTLDLSSIILGFATDPTRAFGSLILMLGILALFFVAEDMLKGLALGKRYYEAIRKPEQLEQAVRESGIMEHLEHLRDEVGNTLHRAEALEASGFDFSDDISVLEAVIGGVDKAEEAAMKHQMDEARGLMVEARKKYDASRSIMTRKLEKASRIADSLSALYSAKSDVEALIIEATRAGANVAEAKSRLAKVNVDEAIDFAKKKVGAGKLEDAEKELAPAMKELDSLRATLSKSAKPRARVKMGEMSKQKLDAVLKSLVSSGKIEAAAIVRRDGLMVSSNLPAGVDKDVIAAMSARMLDRAEMVSSELKRGTVKYVVADSTLGKIITMDVEGTAVLMCLVKPKEDIGFAILAMETASRNVADLLDAG